MGLHVAVKVEFSEETSVTVLAFEPLLALMDLKMLVEVGLLGEGVITAFKSAVVRSLVGVDPQMVEKVMPLSKDFLAIGISACKKSYYSSIAGVLVFIYHKLVSSRNVLVDSDCV